MIDYIHDHIENLTPYYIITDESGCITDAGKVFKIIYPDITGKFFHDIFRIEYHDHILTGNQYLALLACEELSISDPNIPEIRITGEFYHPASVKMLYFVGFPNITTYNYFARNGMDIAQYWQYTNDEEIVDLFKKRSTTIDSFFRMNDTINIHQKQYEYERNNYINIVDSLDVIIFKVNEQNNFVFLNKAWEKILGYTVEESLFTYSSSYIHPDDRATGNQRFAEIKQGIRTFSEHIERFYTKSKEIRWLRIRAKPLLDENNKIIGTTGSFTDVTKEIEYEKKLELILDNVRDEITMVDISDRYVFVSPSVITNRGFVNYTDFINNYTGNTIHPEDKQKIKLAVLENGETELNFEYRVRIKSGEYQWYSGHSKVVYDKTNDQHYLLTVSRNIQDRKNLNKRFDLISNNISDEITMFDLEGNYLYASPSALKQRRYASFEELKKNNAHDKVSTDDWNRMINAVADSKEYRLEHKMERNDGTITWYESNIRMVKDELNGKDYLVIVARNIEEKKKQEQQLELITQNITDEITMFDFEGNYIYASPSVIENREYNNFEEMKDINALSTFIITKEMKEAILYNLKTKGEYKTERKYYTKSGKIIWYDSFLKLIKDNISNKEYILTVSRNIQEKKETENKINFISNNINEQITMFDTEGNYLYATPSAIKIRGYKDFEEMKKINIFSIISEEEKIKFLNDIKVKGESTTLRSIINTDGEINWYESNAKLIFDEFANKEYIISVTRNIDERIKYKESIEATLQKERALNQLKSDFISTSSHEFKTPLAILKTYIEIISNSEHIRNTEGVLPFFEKHLHTMESEIDRMLSLINDTLILEKAYNNILVPHKAETDIIFLLINIVERFNAVGNKLVKLKVNIIGNNVRLINVDPMLMEHVLDNLLSNAIKYSKGNKSPELSINNNNEVLIITIKDYGIGIPSEAMEKLYTPFFRANNTKGVEGTGMGLSIVKKILELHNGTIHIESVVNKGTTTQITIPY